MSTEEMKPLMFALADAIETDLIERGNNEFTGSRKAVLELFEGYSPTVISGIDNSLYDLGNSVVAADQHIFGNVGVVTVVEGRQSTAHCFVYDRSKREEGKLPFSSFWSRNDLYKWLEKPVRAIYERSLFDSEWKELSNGRMRLHEYCRARANDTLSSRECYENMWTIGGSDVNTE